MSATVRGLYTIKYKDVNRKMRLAVFNLELIVLRMNEQVTLEVKIIYFKLYLELVNNLHFMCLECTFYIKNKISEIVKSLKYKWKENKNIHNFRNLLFALLIVDAEFVNIK